MTDALKELINLAHAKACAEHPDQKPSYVPRETFKVKTANGLTKAVIYWIRLHGGQAERVSVMGRRIDNTKIVTDVLGRRGRIGSIKWIPPSQQKGTADIGATICGRSVKLEIKVGRDYQKPAQVKYQKEVEAAGGIYLIVRDLDEFVLWFKEFTNGDNNNR